ncbi:MAG: branched-chain amino acid ABC transporter permease, partial [Candidatus Aerophobetes bacterium]|nr:branched-chain amino acid ABC transporter permease [Candidatus Aerophobetes bacterium]
LVNSHIGRAWIAIRENEDLAESVGIKAYAYKIMAFAISAFIVGLTGSFYAHYVTFISPEMFNFFYVINMLVILIAGGKGTIMGPIIGALIFTALPEYLRGAQAYRMPVYAVILLVVVIFMPKGIVPMVGNIAPRFMKKIRR